MQKIRKERADALRIFLSIPKAAVNNIYNGLSNINEVKEIEDDALDEGAADVNVVAVSGGNATPILRQLFIRYFGTLCKDYF